jgi:hypothetical protein
MNHVPYVGAAVLRGRHNWRLSWMASWDGDARIRHGPRRVSGTGWLPGRAGGSPQHPRPEGARHRIRLRAVGTCSPCPPRAPSCPSRARLSGSPRSAPGSDGHGRETRRSRSPWSSSCSCWCGGRGIRTPGDGVATAPTVFKTVSIGHSDSPPGSCGPHCAPRPAPGRAAPRASGVPSATPAVTLARTDVTRRRRRRDEPGE